MDRFVRGLDWITDLPLAGQLFLEQGPSIFIVQFADMELVTVRVIVSHLECDVFISCGEQDAAARLLTGSANHRDVEHFLPRSVRPQVVQDEQKLVRRQGIRDGLLEKGLVLPWPVPSLPG